MLVCGTLIAKGNVNLEDAPLLIQHVHVHVVFVEHKLMNVQKIHLLFVTQYIFV